MKPATFKVLLSMFSAMVVMVRATPVELQTWCTACDVQDCSELNGDYSLVYSDGCYRCCKP